MCSTTTWRPCRRTTSSSAPERVISPRTTPGRISPGCAWRAPPAPQLDGLRMPKVALTRRVAHAATEMFELVADVERYPQFVPLCESLTLRSRKHAEGREVLTCDMSV